jgi:hypothetical protein
MPDLCRRHAAKLRKVCASSGNVLIATGNSAWHYGIAS